MSARVNAKKTRLLKWHKDGVLKRTANETQKLQSILYMLKNRQGAERTKLRFY